MFVNLKLASIYVGGTVWAKSLRSEVADFFVPVLSAFFQVGYIPHIF